jgi:dihydrodipicolinate synthase/N-acetylneuraminate lyase
VAHLTRQTLRGTWGTLLLPIRHDESIDFDALDEEISALIASGVSGIYSNGSAGEFYAQSGEEYLKINTLLATRCQAAGLPFQVGASHPFPQETIRRIHAAKHLEPDAFQVILPDWFVLRGDEVTAYMERVCREAAPSGVVLYNPPHAKRRLSPEEIGTLSRFPEFLGVKVGHGDDAWYAAMRHHCAGLSIFIPGHYLVTGLQNGAHGSYSNVACIDPAAAVAWNRLALARPAEAMQIQTTIIAFLDRHVAPLLKDTYVNAAADKLLASIGGWSRIGTRLRWPYRWFPESDAANLRTLAQEELKPFFDLRPEPA